MNFLQFKNSFRFLLKKKNYLLINVLGLGVGIASFLILFLYVYNDITYNHFNKNLKNIYRVREGGGEQTKGLLLPKMLEQIPEVTNGTRIFDWDGYRLSYGEKAFAQNVQYVDTGFFSVFTFPFLEKGTGDDIHQKYNAVVSREFAEKYFGENPATDKKLQVRFDNIFLNVNGVVDIPENSSIKFDIVTSYETGEEISPWIKQVHDWYNTFSKTYVLLKDGTQPETIYSKMQKIAEDNFQTGGNNKADLNLLAFKNYHAEQESNRTLIIILSIIALGILSIAMVNFINLTITNSLGRTKEIGIKKVVGAGKTFLVRQIIIESLMVSFIALFIGYLLAASFLPEFNQLYGTQLHLSLIRNKLLLPLLMIIWLTVGLLSGFAPALYWSRLNSIESLQGKIFKGGKVGMKRYSLVVLQFAIAIVLISGTFLVRKQIQYMVTHDPKFDGENVVVAELTSWEYQDLNAASLKFKRIADELKSSPFVESVCFSQCTPGNYHQNYNTFYTEGESNVESIHLRKAYVGRDYFKTFGIKIINGEGFTDETHNYGNSLILNEKAMQVLGYNQIENQIIHESSRSGTPNKIIGEVEDFAYQGAQYEMQPVAHIFSEQENYSDWAYLSIKTRSGTGLQVIKLLKEKWENTQPESTISCFFANDKLNEQYKEYVKINQIIAWFSIVAIVLSCIGLFALSSYAISRRIKEIGVRKVNGAKVFEVVGLLNRDFLRWVVVSFIIAVPLAWFALHRWLEGFALKTEINWWIFAIAGILAVGIALLTVSWQSWRAAIRNPVEALKYE
ncbi:FtsX-like permease family protein [Maribellus comscasis]|uniref:FtsX-like permease family protein n=1 Tax=Maribellus comscasis TaxID=2681766 RepID=A0A6I6JZQ5_9BACT|nr:ABC transporter permease [Maribellus comscasis]QGY44673.1 FtsX-like permease family protein [Maribellus comscasis]